MPNTAGFAAALTVRESALNAAVQATYANSDAGSKVFDNDLSTNGIGIKPNLFLGQLDLDLDGTNNVLVVKLPMWGQVTTTVNAITYVVDMNGVMELTLSPILVKGGADQVSAILLDQFQTEIHARSWTATVTSAATPPEVAAIITGDTFRGSFEATFTSGIRFGLVSLPSIDGSFLGATVAKSTAILGRVRNGALLIGLSCQDDTHDLDGDVDALQDFAGSNDVAGLIDPAAVDIMVDEVHTKLVDGVNDAGATLESFQVQPRDGYFLVSGRVSKTGGAVNFSFSLVPSMFHTRPGAYFQYLKKPRWAKSRTWAALEFSITDLQTDIDRPWWLQVFGEGLGGILTLGMADILIEGLLSAAEGEFRAQVESSKLGGPTPRIQRTVPPPGGVSTRISLDTFNITESGVSIGVSVRSKPTPAKLLGPTVVPETYRTDVLRYIMAPPSGVVQTDPALRIRWTLEDRTNHAVLADADGAFAGRTNFEFTPASSTATDFGVIARLYRQLGAAVTDLATLSVNLHMRAALPPSTYTRWRWQGISPQIGVDAASNNWVYGGEVRVDRWSEWHRTDAPCRSVNAPARYRYDQENADRLPFSLRLLENHRKGLCPYCFYGGPAGINPKL